ncbi:MAG: thioredoxin domain-containing protein [Longimicrobiales bacterium]|nr:thioredoxin domain-containing protein [Longimicrobiales bacterium]
MKRSETETSSRRECAVPRRGVGALLTALVLIVAGCGGSGSDGGSGASGGATSGEGSAPAQGQEEAPLRFNITDLGYNEGDPDAPIRVAEFSDFGCPHCREFHLRSYPTVHDEWVETGMVLWKYVPFVLGTFPNSLEAARAGECAIEQDAFPRMRDRIFDEQPSWLEADNARELFIQYAEDEGLDVERFTSCLEEGRRDTALQQNIEVGQQIGIRGTPTFMIEGVPVQGNRSPEVFSDLFRQMLEERGVEPPGGDGSGAEGGGDGEAGQDGSSP